MTFVSRMLRLPEIEEEGEFALVMQALEAAEQAVGIGHVNADTVVGAWPRPGRVKTLMFSLCGASEVIHISLRTFAGSR
jgi:hypothetical protein